MLLMGELVQRVMLTSGKWIFKKLGKANIYGWRKKQLKLPEKKVVECYYKVQYIQLITFRMVDWILNLLTLLWIKARGVYNLWEKMIKSFYSIHQEYFWNIWVPSSEVTHLFFPETIKPSCPLSVAVQPQTDPASHLYLDRFYLGHYFHKKPNQTKTPFCAVWYNIFNKKMPVK